jgi:hypothetical protein
MNRCRMDDNATHDEAWAGCPLWRLGDRWCNGALVGKSRSRSRSMILLMGLTAGLGIAGGAVSQPMSKEAHARAYQNAEMQYREDEATCGGLSDSMQTVCLEDARGRESVWKAQADAAFKNTRKAYQDWRIATAVADYRVANEKCNGLVNSPKVSCVTHAKADFARAMLDAKTGRAAESKRGASGARTVETSRDASKKTHDASGKVAIGTRD